MTRVGIRIEFVKQKWPDLLKMGRAGKLQMWPVGWITSYGEGDAFIAAALQHEHRPVELLALPPARVRRALSRRRTRDARRARAQRSCYRTMSELVAAYTPWELGVYRIENTLVQPWVLGYKKNTYYEHPWQYLDIDVARSAARRSDRVTRKCDRRRAHRRRRRTLHVAGVTLRRAARRLRAQCGTPRRNIRARPRSRFAAAPCPTSRTLVPLQPRIRVPATATRAGGLRAPRLRSRRARSPDSSVRRASTAALGRRCRDLARAFPPGTAGIRIRVVLPRFVSRRWRLTGGRAFDKPRPEETIMNDTDKLQRWFRRNFRGLWRLRDFRKLWAVADDHVVRRADHQSRAAADGGAAAARDAVADGRAGRARDAAVRAGVSCTPAC